jgi:hypothetical protein
MTLMSFRCKFIKEIGECEWLAQGQALLDLLFLRAANDALRAADADVGERCQCQCRRGGADADGATVESTVEDSSECYRSVGDDDSVR